jgi:hypothetical protein
LGVKEDTAGFEERQKSRFLTAQAVRNDNKHR